MMMQRLALTTLLILSTCAVAPAQQEPQQSTEFNQKVVQIQYAEAHDIADMLHQFIRIGRVGFDQRTNAVVISAPAEEIEVALRLISELDTASAPREPTRTEIISLPRDVATPLLPRLIQPLLGKGSEVAYDKDSGMLVVMAKESEIIKIHELVQTLRKSLDRSIVEQAHDERRTQKPLAISFYFIQAMMGPENSPQPLRTTEPTPRSDPRDDATRAKLEKPIRSRFDDKALESVIENVAEQAQVDIIVNWLDLEAAGIDRDYPVSLRLREAVPARQALSLVLEQMGHEVTVDYAVREGIVRIATRLHLSHEIYLQVYDVQDLAGDVGSLAAGQAPAISYASSESADAPERTRLERSVVPVEPLVALIRATITPNEWSDRHRSASVTQAGNMLVVQHSARGHEAIAELLHKLRAQRDLTRTRDVPPPAMLTPVMGTLANMGFRNAQLLAPLNVTVGVDDVYRLEGIASGFAPASEVKVRGEARRVDESNVELEVNAAIDPTAALPGTLGNHDPLFRLSSTLRLPLNDYVVLAASPGTSDYGQAIMLVVRVTEAK